MIKVKPIIGYDNNGVVYDTGSLIVRDIKPSYLSAVSDIFAFYKDFSRENSSIVETSFDVKAGRLMHKKYVVTYPYEWSASMFKDALLFHLRLLLELDRKGYTLKDALPNNILFDGINPVFVDFLSMLKKENLKYEDWLTARNASSDPRLIVINKMLVPYFIVPFLLIAQQKYKIARTVLSEQACNSVGQIVPSWRTVQAESGLLHKLRNFVCRRGDYSDTIRSLIESNKKFVKMCESLIKEIDAISVIPEKSAYLSYYEAKKENLNHADCTSWLPKQKVCYDSFCKYKPKTVLDIGANTGWFSILAQNMGAKVIAIEVDESCVDNLYLYSKQHSLNILPLRMAFEDLEKKYFGMTLNGDSYARDFTNNPLYDAPVNRLTCDMTLCLALVHHLVLGLGISVAKIMDILSKLTNRVLILEVVTLNDPLIVSERTFFKNIGNFTVENYSVESFIEEGKKHFKHINMYDSHPETRKIIIFQK